MGTRIMKLVAVLALLMGVLAVGGTVSADNTNPNGAVVEKVVHDCQPYNGGQFCIDMHLVANGIFQPANPAGNTSITLNGRECVTYLDATGAQVAQACTTQQNHFLVKDTTIQEAHVYRQFQLSDPIGTICVIGNYHLANGDIQYESTSIQPGAC